MPGKDRAVRPSAIEQTEKIIRERCPDLGAADVRPVTEEGQYNNAFLVDKRLIFRFLRGIRGRTTLPVPDPTYTNLDGDILGELFMGYPLLPGEALWRPAVFAQTEKRVLDQWAQQLAGFLRELHAIPATDLGGDRPTANGRDEWAQLYADFRTQLFPLMRPDARRDVSAHFEVYLDDPALHDFDPAPRHGDFGSGNILYDPQTMAITGIIDFGFAAVGDPAIDLAAASTLGDALFGRFPAYYPGLDTLLRRARFYRGTYALQEALHGVKSGDQQALTDGLAQYV